MPKTKINTNPVRVREGSRRAPASNGTNQKKDINSAITSRVNPISNPARDKSINGAGGTREIITEVARKVEREDDKIVPTEQLVTFELDKEEYASVITDLREIIRIPDITPIPGAPDFIQGILNLRGQIVVVVDLEKRFHLNRDHPSEPQHIIIAEVEDSIFGITVDEVTGVLRVPKASIKQTPQLITSKIHAEYLKGVVILDETEKSENQNSKSEINSNNQNPKSKTKKVEKDQAPESGSRLLLLLDIPKMLAEKELLEFGNVVKETIKKGN